MKIIHFPSNHIYAVATIVQTEELTKENFVQADIFQGDFCTGCKKNQIK